MVFGLFLITPIFCTEKYLNSRTPRQPKINICQILGIQAELMSLAYIFSSLSCHGAALELQKHSLWYFWRCCVLKDLLIYQITVHSVPLKIDGQSFDFRECFFLQSGMGGRNSPPQACAQAAAHSAPPPNSEKSKMECSSLEDPLVNSF